MKGYFVYMFLDIDDNVLYIGSSIHLVVRIEKQHFLSQHGNLSEECILESHKILYHQGVSSDDMKIKERYLINDLKPKYNNKLNNNNKFSFTIDIDWKLYSIDTQSLINKREIKSKKFHQIKNFTLSKNNSNITINDDSEIFRLSTCTIFYEKENKDCLVRNVFGYSCWDDFYFVRINKELYIFCLEVDHLLSEHKPSIHLNHNEEYDEQIIYNLKLLKEKFKQDSYVLIASNKKDSIFDEYYWFDVTGMACSNIINSSKKLFLKYDLFKKEKMIDEIWIKHIDMTLNNLDAYINGEYDWLS